MYENGNKKRIRIDLPSIPMPHFNTSIKNKDKKTIFTILSKFMVVCIFFFLFIFCFSRFGKVFAKEYDEKEFNSNITYIEKTVLSYYEVGNTPKKNGDASSLTLNDLIKEGIIDKNKIDNVDSCDFENSYVTLTKQRDKLYNLKISMNCNGIIEEKENTIKNI